MWPGAISTSFSCKLNWKWLQPNNSIKVEGNYCIDCLTWRTIMVLVYYNWFSITLVLHRKVQIKFRKLKVRLRISTLLWWGLLSLCTRTIHVGKGGHVFARSRNVIYVPPNKCVCVRSADKILGHLPGQEGGKIPCKETNHQLWKTLQKRIKTFCPSRTRAIISSSFVPEDRHFRGNCST